MGFRRLPRAFFESGDLLPRRPLEGRLAPGERLGPLSDPISRKCPVPRTRRPKSFRQLALSWDKFSLAKLSHRVCEVVPGVPSRRGSFLPLVKKDPHHRRERNFCTRRGSFSHRTDFDPSLGPHWGQRTRDWQRNSPPARTRIVAAARPLLHPTGDLEERGARVSTAV